MTSHTYTHTYAHTHTRTHAHVRAHTHTHTHAMPPEGGTAPAMLLTAAAAVWVSESLMYCTTRCRM